MEPETFRLSLNALIQSLRNVTFLLQNQKHDLPSFDTWYGAWQGAVKDDTVMRWVVNARNRIVKQSDLEMHSTALVRLSFDWLNEIEDVLEVPPYFTTHQTIAGLLSTGPKLSEGVITIERRWVDVELPTRELLEATRYAYGRLAIVVRLAHDAVDVTGCDLAVRKPECVGPDLKESLQCMHEIDDDRRLHVDLSSMTQLTEGIEILSLGDIPREVTQAKYGEMTISGDAIARVPQATEMAKRMLSVDKELAPVAWLLRGPQTVNIFAVPVPNQRSKSVQMNRVADLVEQACADGVVFICESWMDVADTDLMVRDGDMEVAGRPEERGECIWVAAVTKDGRSAESITVFAHGKDDEVVFGQTIVNLGGVPNMLMPVIRRWQQTGPLDSG